MKSLTSSFEDFPAIGKWIAASVGLLMLLGLSFATFGGSSTEPHRRGPLQRTTDEDQTLAVLVMLVAKLTNDVEALRQNAEADATASTTTNMPMSPPMEEQPTTVSGLPPTWRRRMNRRQFLEKFELGYRNFDLIYFENVDFSGMNLGLISFRGSAFKSCSFERAIIQGQFDRAKLSKVRLDRSVLSGSFDGALLEDCSFDRTTIGFGANGMLTFRNARLRSVSFEKANVYRSDFDNAIISHGNFAECVVPFDGAIVTDTDLSSLGKDDRGVLDFEAPFCGARQLTRVRLAGIKIVFGTDPVTWRGNCLGGRFRNQAMVISDSDFRNATIDPGGWNMSMKEYLSQIATLDDKCLF